MSRNVFEIEQGLLGFSFTDPGTAIDTITLADFESVFSCQVTSGALNANANTNDKTTPATWCEPESTETVPGVTSYELAFSFLQDPHIAAGINSFLYQHDTEVAFFFIGFNGTDPPKATGRVSLIAGSVGGEGRTPLTFDVTLPCKGKPIIQFGDADTNVIVGGAATGATHGTPGTWTPAGADPVANLAAMPGITASPGTAWATGEYMLLGDASHAYWNGTAWVVGTAP